jgi:hypothetical protein
MTSPYLDRVRAGREMIEQLIATREVELARVTSAAGRRRIEHDLRFLREELARVAIGQG